MKIRTKFLLTNLAITFLLGSTALSGVLVSTRLLEQEINGKYLAVATYAMEKVHRLFSRRFEDLLLLTHEPLLQSATASPEQITRLLGRYEHHFVAYAPYVDLAYFDRTRRCLADSEGRRAGSWPLPAELWQQLERGKAHTLDVTRSELLGEVVFNLACAVRDDRGTMIGMVVGRIPVAALQMIADRPLKLFRLVLPPALDLLDRSGRLLYSSHNPAGTLRETGHGYDLIRDAIAAGEAAGTLLYRGVSRSAPADILIFAQEGHDPGYRGNDWILTITVPERLALASMSGLRNQLTLIIVAIGCFSVGLAILLSRTITRPIAQLSEAASAVGGGRLDIAVPVGSRDEAGQLARTFNSMVQQLNELNHALQIAATVDKLTGALNRDRIEQVLRTELERSFRYNSPLTLILFDIDHFKMINDRHGHPAGDAVLKTVAARVQQAIRTTDNFGRWGGEEFMLLTPGTTLEQAVRLAEKIRQIIAGDVFGEAGQITISCGVTELHPADSEESLIKRADDALYAAKHQGRNRVETGVRG